MKKMIALCTLCMLTLAGCNTMSGFGKDVQKVGSKVETAAKK